MPHSADCPEGRSQLFTFTRRKLSQKVVLIARLPFVLRPLYRHSKCPFRIGDNIAERWIDEFQKERTYYGEVVGICWHPREETWHCLVNWTGGDDLGLNYPCFDGQLVPIRDLRLVRHD